MNKEEITDMARQAGAMAGHVEWEERNLFPVFERFAMLIARNERKDIWEIIKKYGDGLPSNDTKVTCMYLCDQVNERNFK
jgi:hemerythrin superfamily protein